MPLLDNWKLTVLRGVLAVAFGMVAPIWPGPTLGVLVLLFGVYALIEGVLALSAAVRQYGHGYWWLLLLEGIAGTAIGICALIWPGLTTVALLVIIAAWAVTTGILEKEEAPWFRTNCKRPFSPESACWS